MTHVLRWAHAIADIGKDGVVESRVATVAECEAVATALDLLSCSALSARYAIKPLAGGRFRLSGEMAADVTQACVVTLDPVTAKIAEEFSVEFWPEDSQNAGGGEQSVLGGQDVERLAGDAVEAGDIIFEVLSASLDPYPRKPGAEFAWQDPRAGDAASGPFAALGKLKQRR
jgi:hypothetical protein